MVGMTSKKQALVGVKGISSLGGVIGRHWRNLDAFAGLFVIKAGSLEPAS
jgi:hypothetical protein